MRLSRTGGQWSAFHIAANDPVEPTQATVKPLPQPKSGWQDFWKKVEALGLSSLPDSTVGAACIGPPDWGSHVVELGVDGEYRTYRYPFELPSCPDSSRVSRIAEMIGVEFDDGSQKCESAEWIPCARLSAELRVGGGK